MPSISRVRRASRSRGASCLVSPIRDHAFFEQAQFERLLGDDFFQLLGLASEIFDFVAGRGAGGIPGQTPLAGLEGLFRPAVVKALGNAFAAAELGDRVLAAQAVKDDADLFLGRVTLPRRPADALDDLFGRQVGGVGFLSHLRSLGATMSQKSSIPQAAKSVSRVLMADSAKTP